MLFLPLHPGKPLHRKSTRLLFALLLAGILSASACTSFRSPSITTGTERALFWKVGSPTSTVYLLGSVHMAYPDIYPLPAAVEEAFAGSHTLVVEADITALRADTIRGYMFREGLYPQGDSLREHIPGDLKGPLEKSERELGMDEGIYLMRPWFAALTITGRRLMKNGFEPELGVDLHFLKKAKGRKEILELEGGEAQIRMLSNFSPDLQMHFLRRVLTSDSGTIEETRSMVEAWKRGDAKHMEKIIFQGFDNTPESRELEQKMFTDRNRAMARSIEGYLKSGRGSYFVVVGSGHLLGDEGIVKLLAAQGYSPERL